MPVGFVLEDATDIGVSFVIKDWQEGPWFSSNLVVIALSPNWELGCDWDGFSKSKFKMSELSIWR